MGFPCILCGAQFIPLQNAGAFLLFEELIQRISARFLGNAGQDASTGILSESEIIAEVGTVLFKHALSLGLAALIIGTGIEEFAVAAAVYIRIAVRTGIRPAGFISPVKLRTTGKT
jgi:hypothetical protein